ncbi:uncharacterized protein [Antedon mediterranea]|uniref:uncharacterized protein n=1 Tax=Antedon mediterranea TaxID=105859 RepID=UPI003AF676D7
MENVALLEVSYMKPSSLFEGGKSSKSSIINNVVSFFTPDKSMNSRTNTYEEEVIKSKAVANNSSPYSSWEKDYSKGSKKKKTRNEEERVTWVEEDLMLRISNTMSLRWLEFGKKLKIAQKELDKLGRKTYSSKEKSRHMLQDWQENNDETDKLGVLARVCKELGEENLCNKILQGLDDDILRFVAQEAKYSWESLAEQLNVSNIEQIRKRKSGDQEAMCLEVLMIWRTNQSHASDKVTFLASSLDQIKLESVSTFLIQGLDSNFLVQLSVELSKSWQDIARQLKMTEREIIEIKKSSSDESKQAHHAFMTWKKQQPSETDQLGTLAKALKTCGHEEMAKHLIGDLEDGDIHKIAIRLKIDPTIMCTALNFQLSHKIYFDKKFSRDFAKIKAMISKWRAQQNRREDKKQKLISLLSSNGFDSVLKEVFSKESIQASQVSRSEIIVSTIYGKNVSRQDYIPQTTESTRHRSNISHPRNKPETGLDSDFLVHLSIKLSKSWQYVARQLKMAEKEIREIKNLSSDESKQAHHAFMTWEKRQPSHTDKLGTLAKALKDCGHDEMAKHLTGEDEEENIMEMEVDVDDSFVSDEILDIIAEALKEFDVNSLQIYFKIRSSSRQSYTTTFDKSNLLKTLRKTETDFKSKLTEALDSVHRTDLADLLKEKTSQEDNITNQTNKPGSEEMVNTRPFYQHQFSIGTMVEVTAVGMSMYGVIKWIGDIPGMEHKGRFAGVELEEDCSAATDGRFGVTRYFKTLPHRGFFIQISKCKPDGRFSGPIEHTGGAQRRDNVFDSPSIKDVTVPPMMSKVHPHGAMGIQGDQNSCYLDSTIFSMFAFVSVFDELLHRPKNANDIEGYSEVQRVLREDIVYPLRRNGLVKFENIYQLRKLLDKHGSTVGLTDQEKDPEEFLTTLLQEVLKSDPLFKIKVYGSPGMQEMNFYQMFMERDTTLKQIPTVQMLLEQSFLDTDIKLAEIPSCFVVQMPRFGKAYRLYERILPTLELDITQMLDNFPRPCIVCGKLASLECRECSSAKLGGEQIAGYCEDCYILRHRKAERRTHEKPRKLEVPEDFPNELTEDEECDAISTEKMELFAVVCIETSHYVAFVKSGEEKHSKWLFFDSMADRIGDQDGFNIPKITELPHFRDWIEHPEKHEHLSDKELEEPLRRLLCDAYMCFYRSTTVHP